MQEQVNSSGEGRSLSDPHRWTVFAIISLIYFLVYFHRVSTSVIASDMLGEFGINATALGFMSSMYFFIYALEQPLVGYLSDLLGPRRVIAFGTSAAAAGCFIFAMSPGIGWATAGRAMIGIGVGGVYVPAIKSFSQWFRQRDFAAMIGLLMAAGNLGAVIATTPLAWAAGSWGWRATFAGTGAVSLLLALGAFFIIRDFTGGRGGDEPGGEGAGDNGKHGEQGLSRVLGSPQFWILAVLFFGVYGIVLTFQGLWAASYLMAVLSIDRISASNLNMAIPVGFMIGAPFFGRYSDRLFMSRTRVIHSLLAVLTLSWASVAFAMYSGLVWITATLFVMGMATGGIISMLWAHVRDIVPGRILGAVSGFLNPFPFLGVAVFQGLTGFLLDRAGKIQGDYPATAYESSFIFCFIVCCTCLAVSFLLRGKRGILPIPADVAGTGGSAGK